MGLHEILQRTGALGGGSAPTKSGFSASRYYSRNATSAKSFMAPPPSASTGGDLDTRRPYAGVGKSSVNLFGRPVTQKSEALLAKPGAFQGGEDKGGLLGMAAGALGKLGELPFAEAIPFIGTGFSLMQQQQKAMSMELIKGHEQEYTTWAQQQGAGDANTDWMQNTRMMTEFARMRATETGQMSKLLGGMALTPSDDNLGGLAQYVFTGMNVASQGVQRHLGGLGGDQRIKDLVNKSDLQLENNPDLIRIREDVRSGKLKRDAALDELTLAGYGVTEPIGQSAPITGLRELGKGTPFQLFGEVSANLIAAGASLGLETFTDPTNLLSFGVGGGVKMSAKGAAQGLTRLLADAGEAALKDGVEKGLVRAGTDAAKELAIQGAAREQERLISMLPKGVEATDRNLMRYGLMAKDPAVKASMESVGILKRPFVANQHVLDWMQKAENVLDPLSLFGSDRMGRAANKAVSLHIINGATNSLGKHNIAPVMTALEKAGVSMDRISGDLGTAFANVAQQVGGESVARLHTRLGIGVEDAADPVALTNMGQDMLSRHGRDVESLVRHKMDKVKDLIVPEAGETMETAVARERKFVGGLISKMYGLSDEVALGVTAKMSPDQLAVVRFMQYGHMADGLLNARTLSKAEVAAMGLTPEFVDRIIFLGPTQLTKSRAFELRKAIGARDIGEVRRAIGQYDVLEWNLSQALSDDELLTRADELLDGLAENLPDAIDPASLTPAMRAFQQKFGDSMQLGLRGEDVFAVGKNKAGRITSIDPFMDYVRGVDMNMGDIKPAGVVSQLTGRLLNSISGSQIVIEQNRRFAQRMAENVGLSREQSDQVMHLIRQEAAIHEVSSARGLYSNELYSAAQRAQLPQVLKDKMTTKQIQNAIFFAHEGSLGKVGLSQKFTGRLKAVEANRLGTTRLGTLAERYYPNVRFKWNPFFQFQEGIETPVLLIARGMASPGQFTGPLTGVRAGLREARGAERGSKLASFWEGKRAEIQRAHDIDYQTAVMMDAFASDSRYATDMVEHTDVVRYGSAAASRAASSSEGRALTALLNDNGVARVKTRGQLIAFRRDQGDNIKRMLQRESPVQWNAMRAYYSSLGVTDEGEVAVRWFNDMLIRNDPNAAFSAVMAHNNPAEFFRPSFLGKRARWSEKVVMEGLSGEMLDEGTTFAQLRARYLDPKDTVVTPGWMEERLRALGADEQYIEKTKWRMEYPTEAEFEATLAEIGGPEEAARIMDYHRIVAEDEGLPLIESLADKYHGAPKSLDEATGQWKPTTLFQLTVDAAEARGMSVVPLDHEAVVVGGKMAQIGQPKMPDIGLPPAVAELEWEGHALAPYTELVPMNLIADIQPGNALRMTPAELNTLAADIKSNGIREPIQLTYGKADRTVKVDEGNHRVAALIQLAGEKPDALKGVNIPVTIIRHEGAAGGTAVRGAFADEFGYVPANLRPSDIGIGDAESAAIRRHDTALRRDTAVKDLTPAQAKGRTFQQARAQRAADPKVGTPGLILGVEDGRLIARNADGKITHRLGGRKTPQEWVEELQNNMSDEQLAEHASWYSDMRRGFMALSENQQEEATHLLMAFGITQLNTSPVDGMKFMLRVVETMRRGQDLPADAKVLQKTAGLNGSALKHFLEEGYVSQAGMGQKLIDFVDSLIGVDGRTVPVRGPKGTWGAVAGDIWAKRDVGYIDAKMLKHLQYAYGDDYAIRKIRVRGENGKLKDSFRFTDKKNGQSFDIDAKQVGGNPNDVEYDAIIEFYNDATDYLNQTRFLGRTDWVPAEAQALGWFKGKTVFGDETGDPRTAFYDSVYSTRVSQVEVTPSATAPMHVLYPEVSERTAQAIAGRTANLFNDEASRLAGTRTISSNQSVVIVDGRAGSATNFEVMSSPDSIRRHLAVLGTTSGQARVRATRATLAKPTKSNGVRHMVEVSFPSSIAPDEMQGALRALAEDAPEFFGDADLTRRADGTYVVRVVANAGENLTDFTARMNDVQLRDLYSTVSSPEGYARGRYVNPDEPMAAGAREQGIKDLGQRRIQQSLTDAKPINYGDSKRAVLGRDLWDSVQAEVDDGWGGLTVDLHNGKRPKAYGEKRGGGPYATGISDTTSLPLDVNEADFHAAVDAYIEAHRGDLSRQNAYLGVFRDPDRGTIDLDVNLLVDDWNEVEGVQLYLQRPGGAYDFTTGNGVYSPKFDPAWSNDIKRGYADVVELENDWTANPNGEGYAQHLEDQPDVRRELDREGRQWGRMVYEDAYQSLAARETAAHRAGRANAGAAGFDLTDPAGYLQRSPRGRRAARLAAADSARGRRLFQRTPGGAPRGAIEDAGTALSQGGKKPRRAQIYVSPKRKAADTLAHEYAHDYVNRTLQPSAIRRAKAIYAGREGTAPTIGAKSRQATLTVDEQEWLADQLIEYMRQGPDAMRNPALVPLAEHYSKYLKDRKVRVEADPTVFDAEVTRHQAEMAAYEGRRTAHEAERAAKLAEGPAPDVVEAGVQRDAIRAVHEKWDNAGARNGPRMEGDLVKLEQQGVDVTDELNLLDEYQTMERQDYESAEEFKDARSDTWDELLDSLRSKHENYFEDLGLDEAALGATPTDIGPFAEVAPTAPVKPRGKMQKVELHPEVKDLFDTIDRTPPTQNAYNYDVNEQAALNWMYAGHRRSDRVSKDLIHFKSDRSWLERSLNHPYFGLYPLSYMWGKILPEMVEFLALRPFGLKTPWVAADMVNTMYQHTMNQMENDPELKQFMAENEDAFRAIGMLVPGVPWDLPVNSPLWLRRYVEGVATNLQKDIDGEQPEDYSAWQAFVTDVDAARIVSDTIGYTSGPSQGAETLLGYPGLVAKTLGGLQPKSEDELANTPDFVPPVRNNELPPLHTTVPQQPVPQPEQPEFPEGSVEELQARLGGSYEEVVSAISGE